MNDDYIALIRGRTRDALDRARLLKDPVIKREWEDVAAIWRAILDFLEAADKGDAPGFDHSQRGTPYPTRH